MGNQLSSAVPSLIFPVETYLSDLHEFHFQSSLGSTRFMKVVKALHAEGPCVLKVFVINDPVLPLQPYMEQVEDVRSKVADAPNCLPFERVMVLEKAIIIARQYGKDNLYDRLSTRPFLMDVEKRWLAFQLLKALEQCHTANVCHGDIKSQNILVNSWNWLWLTDFASFKPSTLPYDNPAYFSYFFDSRRRRTCYIAPERFKSASEIAATVFLPGDDRVAGSSNFLTHSMDIFSVGCVLTELFTDGSAPFDFSQLLAFRELRYYPSKVLESIAHPAVREMIESMIERDPAKRLTAAQYLDKYRDDIFPDIFYTFLWPYAQTFVQNPLLSADSKIRKIENELNSTIAQMRLSEKPNVSKLHPSYVILISMVTSLSRSVKYCENKLKCLRLLNALAKYSEANVILDRILPYVPHDRVRAEAVHIVAQILSLVDVLPESDTRIFSEYILPALQRVLSDACSLVRLALAEEMAVLADTAARFVEYASQHCEDDPHIQAAPQAPSPRMDYCKETKLIQEAFQDMVVTLLCDSENCIRRSLVCNGLARLCAFFGKQKTSDVLLSHMITFLNDKNDWRLRATFYDCCPALASYIGWQSGTVILKPLFEQGLRDQEDAVVQKTLAGLASLSPLGLIQKPVVYELLAEATPFLSHPNASVRVGATHFFCEASKRLNLADVHCKVMPLISPFLQQPLIKCDRDDVILCALKPPLPKAVWDLVMSAPRLISLLDFLREKRWQLDSLSPPSQSVVPTTSMVPDDPQTAVFYQKLLAQGLIDEHEERLVTFANVLLKMHKSKYRQAPQKTDDVTPPDDFVNGTVNLVRTTTSVKYADLTTDRGRRAYTLARRFGGADDVIMNEEWQHMFGGESNTTKEMAPPEADALSTGSSEQTLIVTAPMSELDVTPTIDDRIYEATNQSGTAGYDIGEHPMSSTTISLDKLSLTSSTMSSDMDVLMPGGKRRITSVSSESTTYACINGDQVSLNGNIGVLIDTSSAADTNVQMSECRNALSRFVELKREEWRRNARAQSNLPSVAGASTNRFPPTSWKPAGQLLGHAHEHKASVNRLSVHPSGRFFVSCGSDGAMKLWDCQKFEGRSLCNSSTFTYDKIGGKVKCVSFLYNQIVCSSDNGLVQILNVDAGCSKPSVSRQYQVDIENDGPLIDMVSFFDGSTNIVVGMSHHGQVICWDQRQLRPAWRFKNRSRFGLVSSLAVDLDQFQWACVGTATGRLILWDLRFQLSINVCQHPAEVPVLRLWNHPSKQSHVISSMGGGRGELSDWDLETGARQAAIWPCPNTPLLSYPSVEEDTLIYSASSYCTTGAYAFPSADPNLAQMIVGDSEGNISFWDSYDITRSSVISSSGKGQRIGSDTTQQNVQKERHLIYKRQVVDGVRVYFVEHGGFYSSPSGGSFNRSSTTSTGLPESRSWSDVEVTTAHHDVIADVGICRTSSANYLFASGSRDGIIKVWK